MKYNRIRRLELLVVAAFLLVAVSGKCLVESQHSKRLNGLTISEVDAEIAPDIEAQYVFLKEQIRSKDSRAAVAGDWADMFSLGFYGYFISNLLHSDHGFAAKEELLLELKWTIDKFERNGFKDRLTVGGFRGGIMYAGQHNLLMGAYLLAGGDDPKVHEKFSELSKNLYEAFLFSPHANVESYPDMIFPVDNITALYSLLIHDRLYGTAYAGAAEKWITFMDGFRDEETGLFLSGLKNKTGAPFEVPRGCALSWTFAFTPCINAPFAAENYRAYRNQYFSFANGYAAIREYPAGADRGFGDVDAGPVLFGVGTVASGIGIAAAKANNDRETFSGLVRLMETFGFPRKAGGSKYYVTKKILLQNVFAAWALTNTCWLNETPSAESSTTYTTPPANKLLSRAPTVIALISAASLMALAAATTLLAKSIKQALTSKPQSTPDYISIALLIIQTALIAAMLANPMQLFIKTVAIVLIIELIAILTKIFHAKQNGVRS